jgi:hypothetical protein
MECCQSDEIVHALYSQNRQFRGAIRIFALWTEQFLKGNGSPNVDKIHNLDMPELQIFVELQIFPI